MRMALCISHDVVSTVNMQYDSTSIFRRGAVPGNFGVCHAPACMACGGSLITLIDVLKQRIGVIALCLAIVLVTVGVGTLLTPLRYTSDATLRIGTAKGGSVDFINYQPDYSDRVMNTLAKYSESSAVAEQLRAEFGLRSTPLIRTAIIAKTELFQLSVTSESPQLAQTLAAKLAEILAAEDSKSIYGDVDQFSAKLRQDVDIAFAEFSRTRAAFERAAAAATPDKETLETLRRAADLSQTIYQKKLEQLGEFQILSAAKSHAFAVLSPPTLPERPSTPNLALNLGLGLLLGLLGGAGLALLFDKLDPTLHSAELLRAALHDHAPVLGGITLQPRRFRQRWSEFFAPNSQQTRALDHIVERLNVLQAERKSITIGVISAESGEGKTVLAANLAEHLARAGKQTALIDADRTHARMVDLFGLPTRRGLGDVLVQKQYWANVLQPGARNLQIMPAGNRKARMSAPFTTKRIQPVLAELAEVFDCVLVDTPALLSDSDGMALACAVDAVIVVVRCHKTRRKALTTLFTQLHDAGVDVLGVLVNADSAAAAHVAPRPPANLLTTTAGVRDTADAARHDAARGNAARNSHARSAAPPPPPLSLDAAIDGRR
jgi:capsular exopolysaccharide synthesis family protein